MLVYLLALGASLLFALGSVVQQRVASQAPPDEALRLRLLWHLARQPVWLLGVGTALVGNLLTGTALTRGSVALVQPLLVSRLLFALPMSAIWSRQRVPWRDVLAALVTAAGLGLFLLAGSPTPAKDPDPSFWQWLITGGAILLITAALVRLARSRRADREATMLGLGAGMLFGLQAGLMNDAVGHIATEGILGVLTTWTTYAVVVVAVTGTLLLQSAYQMAPLVASYPSLSAAEPLAGIAIGVGVLGTTLRATSFWLALEVLALLLMTAGIALLARSPLVTGELPVLVVAQEEGQALRLEEEIEQELRCLAAALERLAQPPVAERRRQHDHAEVSRRRTAAGQALSRLDELREDVERRWQEARAQCPAVDSSAYDDADRRVAALEARLREVEERAQRLHGWAAELNDRVDALAAA